MRAQLWLSPAAPANILPTRDTLGCCQMPSKQHLVHFDVKSSNLLLGYRDRRPVCKVWVGLVVRAGPRKGRGAQPGRSAHGCRV